MLRNLFPASGESAQTPEDPQRAAGARNGAAPAGSKRRWPAAHRKRPRRRRELSTCGQGDGFSYHYQWSMDGVGAWPDWPRRRPRHRGGTRA